MLGRTQSNRRDRGSAIWQKVASTAVACVLASGAVLSTLCAQPAAAAGQQRAVISWLTAGFNAMRTNYNNRETTIGPANVSRIHQLWNTNLGGVMIAQPVEAAGVEVQGERRSLIYEGTEHGDFYAIRASDGHVVWHANLGSLSTACTPYFPDGVFGVGDSAAIAFNSPGVGVIYVLGGDGNLHALDLATGAEQPGWPVTGVFDTQEATFGGLNLFRGRLYATVADHCDQEPPYSGSVVEINVAKRAIEHRFYPAGPPEDGISGGGIWGPAGVSIDPATHDVFTATGNALTTPENYMYSNAVVEMNKTLGVISAVSPKLRGRDVDFGSTPVLFRPRGCPSELVAAENKSGVLVVFSEGNKLGAQHSQRLQLASVNRQGFKGDPAWDPITNMLYVANTSDSSSGPFEHGLVALKAAPNCSLSLAWQRVVGPPHLGAQSPPTVANGVVYYSDATGDTEYAFNAATGRELWHSTTVAGTIFAPATIVNGMLLVPSWDEDLHAFGLAKR